jgi:[ribosomal protein S5]-alanine N-acetyltransferase
LSAQHKTEQKPPSGLEVAVSNVAKMSALTQVSLRNELVALGPVLPEDTGALFLWLNDVPAASLDVPYRPVDWMNFKSWLDKRGTGDNYVFFAIRKLCEPQIIGFVELKNIQAIHRSAELGVRIGIEAERARGYGRAAVTLALRYAWSHLNLHRVSLRVFSHNRRAIASYRASGFEEEGLLRQAEFIDGRWTDVVPMAVLNPLEREMPRT